MDLRQTAGLLMFFIVYVVVGGIVFMILESQQEPPHKLKEKQFYDFEGSSIYILLKYQMTADYLFSNADQLKQFNISDYSRMKLMEMARKSFKDNEEEYADKWGFFNSFFFATCLPKWIEKSGVYKIDREFSDHLADSLFLKNIY